MKSLQPEFSMATLDALIAAAPDEETPAPTTNIISIPTGTPTMSSLQIAEITGKNHTHVLRDIENILEQAEIDQTKFESIYSDSYGRPQKCYILPRRECDLVVSGYSVKYRLAIIDRWQELEAQQSRPDPMALLKDPHAMRAMLLSYTEQVITLENEVKELAPKAAGLDRLAETSGTYCITDAAKSLGLRPKQLFDFLEAKGWIYKRAGEWIAMQTAQNLGHMVHKVRTYEGTANIHTTTQARITTKGLAKLSALLSKQNETSAAAGSERKDHE